MLPLFNVQDGINISRRTKKFTIRYIKSTSHLTLVLVVKNIFFFNKRCINKWLH